MVKAVNLMTLSPSAREEILGTLSEPERNWVKRRSRPNILIEFPDRYRVSREQQKKAHALLRDIAMWAGYTPIEAEKAVTKQAFLDAGIPTLTDTFSLSDCSMETARLYITYLIDFCVFYGVPCRDRLWEIVEDVKRYTYACMMAKKCLVCGKKAQFCHYDAVGMGRNRQTIPMVGMLVFPACAEHHAEAHNIGHKSWMAKYHAEPIELTRELADVWGLTKRNKEEVDWRKSQSF